MEEEAFILDDKIRKINAIASPKNKHNINTDFHWYNINGIDYLFKYECCINSFVNELVAEELSKIINISNAEYEIIRLNDNNPLNKVTISYLSEDCKFYHLITKDFKKPNKKYFYADDLITKESYYNYLSTINNLRYSCCNVKNFVSLKKKLFKFLILNFFIGEVDASYPRNIMFERNKMLFSPLELAPLFDHADAFYFEDDIEDMSEVATYFGVVKFPSDKLKRILYEYPENIDVVKKLININFNGFFKDFQNIKPIILSNNLYNSYVDFCERKQDILYRSLK